MDIARDLVQYRVCLSGQTPPRPSIDRFDHALQIVFGFVKSTVNTRTNADRPNPGCYEIRNYISQKNADAHDHGRPPC